MGYFSSLSQADLSANKRCNNKRIKTAGGLLLQIFESLHLALWARPRNMLYSVALGTRNLKIGARARIKGRSRISVGNNFQALDRLWLETIMNGDRYQPLLRIGDRVTCSDSVHIAATHRVSIGSDVLIGSRVTITDHNHGIYQGLGQSHPEQSPWDRPLTNDAETVVEDKVWLGDGVVVLAGSHIGRGCIIGANATVNGFIPERSIAVGNPAKVIRCFQVSTQTWVRMDGFENENAPLPSADREHDGSQKPLGGMSR